jgi:hypothetical protein
MYKLNRSSICKNYCEKICKAHLQHILTRREDKRSPREDKENDHAPKSEGADFFNTCPKRAVLKKFKFDQFFLVHIRFTPSKEPKAFKTNFLRKRPWKLDHLTTVIFHGPTSWSIVSTGPYLTFNIFIMWPSGEIHAPCLIHS